jgi:septal ring factor EnvC (AmiA/AmiB activator)
MRPLAIALLLTPLLLAGSVRAQRGPAPLQQALQQARSEQAAADAETARLEKAAANARNEAERLKAEESAAAQAIEAAEARITAAEAEYRLAADTVASERARLAEEQRPASALLAGLAVMARRPPLLALADGGGTADLVKISVLLDSTLPVIRNRTRALSAELGQTQRVEASALAARAELLRSRQNLASRRVQFAALEQRAVDRSLAAGGQALKSGDVAIAAGEEIERLRGEQADSRSERALAALLAAEGPLPPRPFAPSGPEPRPPFPYVLPVAAPVVEGLGAVNDSGVRSRGVSFATPRGTPVAAPADGVVRFAGPFRDYDGILILDHGDGWMSLIVNVSSQLKAGDRVRLGQPLGPALGPVELELSHNGRGFSPALIAGSSQTLSNAVKGG